MYVLVAHGLDELDDVEDELEHDEVDDELGGVDKVDDIEDDGVDKVDDELEVAGVDELAEVDIA